MGRDTVGTAGLNWPKGYSIPYDVMLSYKTRREVGRGAAAEALVGHRSVGTEQLFLSTLLVFWGFISLFLIFSFFL